jgi:hypothetical protein
MTMSAMGAGDEVVSFQSLTDTAGNRFLTYI